MKVATIGPSGVRALPVAAGTNGHPNELNHIGPNWCKQSPDDLGRWQVNIVTTIFEDAGQT